MNDIKMVLNDLSNESMSELLLEFTGTYSPDNIRIITYMNNDIKVISESDIIKDVFYGRKIDGKYYFARHEAIMSEKPYIDYYDEFFSNGIELNCI